MNSEEKEGKASSGKKRIRKRSFVYTGVLLFLILLVVAGACAVKTFVDPAKTLTDDTSLDEVRSVLRNGDWLVTRGVHQTDNFVATVTNADLSHAAIYDAQKDEVIEAEGKGIHATALKDFVAKSRRVQVLRPMWSSEESSAHAVKKARGFIGKGYNYTGLVGLNTPNRYYCTQLVVKVYEPFMAEKPDNPIPKVIRPSQLYHWGRILYDSGP